MKTHALIVVLGIWVMSGCALIEQQKHPEVEPPQAPVSAVEKPLCWVEEQGSVINLDENCDLSYWLQYWVDIDELTWPQRRAMIEQLGEEPANILRKILLSQSRGTPYQARLRAQGWADELMPDLTSVMRDILMVLVYKPSQELLEFESALTILSQINTSHSREIAEQRQQLQDQQQRLQEQQQQIDQLLKIEASMMEKREDISQ